MITIEAIVNLLWPVLSKKKLCGVIVEAIVEGGNPISRLKNVVQKQGFSNLENLCFFRIFNENVFAF